MGRGARPGGWVGEAEPFRLRGAAKWVLNRANEGKVIHRRGERLAAGGGRAPWYARRACQRSERASASMP